jgi:dTDP-3-amino-3,4,6-trideoxy-alpha-D-glucose transaminase
MADRVGIVDLAEQYEQLGPAMEEATLRVLRSGRFVLSEEVTSFESEWAAFCGAKHAVGVANGTDALYLALRACGLGPGDRVVVPAYTFIATYEAVVRAGAEPLLADVTPGTADLDPASVRAVAEEAGGARAVLGVHLYGIPCDARALQAALEPWDGFVVEDAAQAHGASWACGRAGSLGRAAAFSFYPTKNLSACGDAGAVTTSDPQVDEALRSLRDHGRDTHYLHSTLGTNSRLDAVQAAVLRVKLAHLEAWTEQRRQVAAWWMEALAPSAERGLLRLPEAPEGSKPAWHLFSVRAADRDRVREALDGAGIDTATHYPEPVHHQPAVRERLAKLPGLPESEAWAREVLNLPCHPHVPQEATERAAEALARL